MGDVSDLVVRCPELLAAETDLLQVEAELGTAQACLQNVSRELLEELMGSAPRLFLVPARQEGLGMETEIESSNGGRLAYELCRKVREGLFCQSDTEAAQKIVSYNKLYGPGHMSSWVDSLKYPAYSECS